MLNKMVLQGRLVADPELKQTQSGLSVASVTIAWSEKYKENERNLFLNCTFWRNSAETLVKYFKKGQEIVIEGTLETRKWTDSEGNNRSLIDCQVDKIHFCGKKEDNEGNAPAYASTNAPKLEEIQPDDDLPF